MDTLIGITGKDFVLMASDAMCGRSIIVFKQDEDKQLQLNNNVVLGMAGPQGDRDNFGNYIKRNIALKELRDQHPMTTAEIANFTRNELHESMRSSPYQVNILIGGVDADTDVPSLYWSDYLASMTPVTYGVQGHAGNFLLSVLDSDWKKDMTREEALAVFNKCTVELKARFLINMPNWVVRIITKDGVEEVKV